MSGASSNDDDIAQRVIMSGGGMALHDAFQRDVLRLLENTDISDEDRQRILSNTACPCCGGSASMVVSLTKANARRAASWFRHHSPRR